MSDQKELLIKYRMEKAAATLEAAKVLFREDNCTSAVNRIYYAMFYAVSALLSTKGLSSSKHSGTLSLFNKEFVNKGLVDKDFGRFYSRMFRRRQKGDYQDFVKFNRNEVESWLKQAEEFNQALARLMANDS